METTQKARRQYRKITKSEIAKHQATEALTGNGTRAVEAINPTYANPADRAYRIRRKAENMPTLQYLNDSLEAIASDGVRELSVLVHSADERTKLSAIKYAIDHIRGKATQKSISITGKMNIQSVID